MSIRRYPFTGCRPSFPFLIFVPDASPFPRRTCWVGEPPARRGRLRTCSAAACIPGHSPESGKTTAVSLLCSPLRRNAEFLIDFAVALAQIRGEVVIGGSTVTYRYSQNDVVVRKNSIRLPSHRDAGTYLFGFPALANSKNQSCEEKILLSRTDRVPS